MIGKKKSIRDYTDAELKAMTNRLNLENNFREALKRNVEVSKGHKFVSHIGKQIVVPALTNASKNALEKYLNEALTKSNTSQNNKKKKRK